MLLKTFMSKYRPFSHCVPFILGGSSSSSSSNVDVIVNHPPAPAEPSKEESDVGFLQSSNLALAMLIWLVALTVVNLTFIFCFVIRCPHGNDSSSSPKASFSWSSNQQRSVIDNAKNSMKETSYQENTACVQFESIEDVLGTVVPVKRSHSTCSARKETGLPPEIKL